LKNAKTRPKQSEKTTKRQFLEIPYIRPVFYEEKESDF